MRSDLVPTEARVFRAYWQDGVLDLLAGLGVVLIGLGWLAGFPLAGVVVPPIALVTWPILRSRITGPRLGRVRFGPDRRFEMRHGLIAVVSLGVVLCGFVATRVYGARGTSDLVRWLAPGIPALILMLLSLSSAAALKLPRFAAYAVGFAVAALAVSVLDADPGWALAAGGLVAAIHGAFLLARFVREFPVLSAEMDR